MGFPIDFLNQLADERELTDREKEVFLAKFGDDKNRLEIAQIFHLGDSAISTRFTGIYNKFQITVRGPVKESKLKDYLNNKYQQWLLQNTDIQINSAITKIKVPYNPFIPLCGSIKKPQQLFGREHEIRRIFELLNSGSSVALVGEEGIGKSSILQAVSQQAQTQLYPPRKPVYLDLGHVIDEADFYFALCDQIGIEEQKGYRLSRTLKRHQLLFLLILDNVEKMAWDGFTNQVRSQIRALATDGNPPLRLVVAARTPLNKLFPDSGMVSPFENICQEEMINRWDKETCCDFIASRLEHTSIQFSNNEITKLIQTSRGHPQQLMRLCYELYNIYNK
jgi:hypothetical protein